jgi:hypothetical protein
MSKYVRSIIDIPINTNVGGGGGGGGGAGGGGGGGAGRPPPPTWVLIGMSIMERTYLLIPNAKWD